MMPRSSTSGLALAGVVAAIVGCSSPPAPPATVYIRVLDEEKAPVAGAEITSHGDTITKTGDDGRAQLVLTGREGTVFDVLVRCPNGYRSPARPLLVKRLMTGEAESPEYLSHCGRLRHSLSVTIRTEGAANMRILHLGREVAHTDETGLAHVMIEGQVLERIDLLLDTSDAKFAKLHPQNPVSSFIIGAKDDSQTVSVKFTSDPKPIRHAAHRVGPKAL